MKTIRRTGPRGVRGPSPLVVGLGGTARANSSTERVLKLVLEAAEHHGARIRLFSGRDLDLPMYNPENESRDRRAVDLVDALRGCDAVVVASPGYHGAVSGLVKNALDYVEDLRSDERAYLDQRAFGCVSCAYGWQAAVATLTQLRTIGHALRAWPTPLGLAVNSAELSWDARGLPADNGLTAQIDTLAAQLLRFAALTGAPRAAATSWPWPASGPAGGRALAGGLAAGARHADRAGGLTRVEDKRHARRDRGSAPSSAAWGRL